MQNVSKKEKKNITHKILTKTYPRRLEIIIFDLWWCDRWAGNDFRANNSLTFHSWKSFSKWLSMEWKSNGVNEVNQPFSSMNVHNLCLNVFLSSSSSTLFISFLSIARQRVLTPSCKYLFLWMKDRKTERKKEWQIWRSKGYWLSLVSTTSCCEITCFVCDHYSKDN